MLRNRSLQGRHVQTCQILTMDGQPLEPPEVLVPGCNVKTLEAPCPMNVTPSLDCHAVHEVFEVEPSDSIPVLHMMIPSATLEEVLDHA